MNEENKTCKPSGYVTRLVDKEIENTLKYFGAISIEGPRWCGKTWCGKNHAHSEALLDMNETRALALLDSEEILNSEMPILLDEWTLVPKLWDIVRRKCDEDNKSGKFILTCSTSLSSLEKEINVFHSGIGRFSWIYMHTMSLYEMGNSSGKVSLLKMKNNEQKNGIEEKETSLDDIAFFVIRGGWPRSLSVKKGEEGIFPNAYVNGLINEGLKYDKNRDSERIKRVLKSLSRNESTYTPLSKILSDITADVNDKEEVNLSRKTLDEYMNTLERLHLIEDQIPYSENVRSRVRIGKSVKRHFADTSIPSSLLGLTRDKLKKDLKTFGLLFESLVAHDLRIYIESLGGKMYHFKDRSSDKEADAVLEFSDGEYALVEVKLGYYQTDEAIKNLLSVKDLMDKPPVFMLVVLGVAKTYYKDKESGVYVAPLTSLGI